jgi:hypothetical protein
MFSVETRRRSVWMLLLFVTVAFVAGTARSVQVVVGPPTAAGINRLPPRPPAPAPNQNPPPHP